MANTIERKCDKCKGIITIDRSDISNVLYFNGKYYHSSCFEEIATQRAVSKRGKPEMWQDGLDRMLELEMQTKKMLNQFWAKDDLNSWLLNHYDVSIVPTYFWQVVADLENGKYKQQKCKPITTEMLYKMWMWGQKRLDGLNVKNKTNRNGPKNDSDRLRYDLAVLISHTGDYIKYTARTKQEVSEIKSRIESTNKINSEKIYSKPKEKQEDNSILDLMNDIF